MLASLFARRYLFSAKSRSVINLIAALSVVAVAIPVAAMVILLSVTNGFEELIHGSYSVFDAPLQIQPRTGHDFPIEEIDTTALSRIEGIDGWSAILEQKILIEANGHQITATLRGVDDHYGEVLPIADAVTVGTAEYRLGELDRLIMGHLTGYELGFRQLLGAKVNLYAVRRGSFSSLVPFANYTTRQQVPVVGFFSVDYAAEREYVVGPLRLAQEMLEREHAVSAILIRTQHPERVRRALEELLGEEFRVVDSEELRASFYRLVRLEKWGIFFIALLVLLIASFSVVGALSMLILEKRDERLTLHALGASDGFIRSIFRREGYLICLLGGVIGLVLGVALSLAQQELGLIRMPVETFLTDAYPVKLRATNLLLVAGVTALVGWGLCSLTVHNMIKQEKRL